MSMETVARFEKVSFEQYKKDCEGNCPSGLRLSEDALRQEWEGIKMPSRSTSGSAGYDFFIPYQILITPVRPKIITTGIRCKIKPGWALYLYPKSGLGFKYETRLLNTIGVVDAKGIIYVC